MKYRILLCIVVSAITCLTALSQTAGNLNGVMDSYDPNQSKGGTEVVIFPAKRVITMEKSIEDAPAVAVYGRRIIGVGKVEQLKSLAGSLPVRVDDQFKDKIIMPGFIDQHLHPVLAALTLTTEVIAPEDWNMPDHTYKAATSPQAYRARLVQAEQAMKDSNEPLFSWGYHKLWHGPMSRQILDQISATRPIIIWHRSTHEVYLNTAALKLLNISSDDVANRGTASVMTDYQAGHFWEQGFMNTPVMPKVLQLLATPERLARGLKQMVAYEHVNGVTSYNEPGAIVTPEMWQMYEKILGAGDTPMYSTFLPDGRGIIDVVGLNKALDAVEDTVAEAPEGTGKKLMFLHKQIKFFADGAVISQYMQMKQPYIDGHHGEWMIEPDDLERRIKLFWDVGYQEHIHVNGDLGAETVMNILARRMKENPRKDHRFVMVHFANSTDLQIEKLSDLGAIFSVNPYYTVGFADKFVEGLGKERADMMVRSASIIKRTPHLSFHSDMPMAPSDPLFLAWSGVNRITPSGRVAGPSQRISVDVAMRAITIEAAYSLRQEERVGSIRTGKIANFTVLDADPYKIDPSRLKDIPVVATLFEGKVYPVPIEHQRGRVAIDHAESTDNESTALRQIPFVEEANETHEHPKSSDEANSDLENCVFAELSQKIGIAYSKNIAKTNNER